jgi:hypothetical protein
VGAVGTLELFSSDNNSRNSCYGDKFFLQKNWPLGSTQEFKITYSPHFFSDGIKRKSLEFVVEAKCYKHCDWPVPKMPAILYQSEISLLILLQPT